MDLCLHICSHSRLRDNSSKQAATQSTYGIIGAIDLGPVGDICQTSNVGEKYCNFNNLWAIAKLAYNLHRKPRCNPRNRAKAIAKICKKYGHQNPEYRHKSIPARGRSGACRTASGQFFTEPSQGRTTYAHLPYYSQG